MTSEKDLVDDSEEGEDDDDYIPTKNENDEEQSDASEESEHDRNEPVEENNKEIDANIKPYDESKTNELWKTFTSTSSNSNITTTAADIPKPTTKVFDYAGEKVSVPVSTPPSLKRPAASSSNSVLDRLGIGKKQKISTLEKSRLDWSAHKESESLTEDLDSHRRGKDSYVEKKAFLQRSELRQHDHYLTNVKKK
jgi:hypothetical protein